MEQIFLSNPGGRSHETTNIVPTPQVVFPHMADVFHNNVLTWTARTFVPDTKIAGRKYGNFPAVGRAWIILKIKLLRIEHRLG